MDDPPIKDLVAGWHARAAIQQPTHAEAREQAAKALAITSPAKSVVQEYLHRHGPHHAP